MLPASLAPLRHGPFARFWFGAFVSNIGTWMETVALGIYVTRQTGTAVWPGIVAAAGFVPIALLGPVGGALADRLPRRALLLTTTLVQAALAALLTALTIVGEPASGVVALVALASGCAAAIGFPAYQATIPDLVPPEDLMAAIGLGSAQWNLGRIIGPLLAGVVIHLGGISWALAVNALSFLAVVAALLTITLPPPHHEQEGSLRSAIRAGWQFTRREPGIQVSLRAMALNTLLAAPFIAFVPVMGIEVLDSGDFGAAVLVTAQGIGAVVAALSLGGLGHRFGVRRVMTGAISALPVALLLYAGAPVLAASALALVAVGACYLAALSSFTTIAQQRSPAQLRGRVLSIHNVVLGSLYPLGTLLQGAIADSAGLRATTAGAALVMAGVLGAVHLRRPGITRVLDVPAAVT